MVGLVLYNIFLASTQLGIYHLSTKNPDEFAESLLDVIPPINWDLTRSKNVLLDIGIPVAGQDDKLHQFVRHLGIAMTEFQQNVVNGTNYTIRLLITRYSQDKQSELWRQTLLNISRVDSVVFVTVNETPFARAAAINALHVFACQTLDCVLTIVDVDMEVGAGYLRNVLAYVEPRTVYFPIVWSEYRPSSVALVEAMLGRLPKFDTQKGLWLDSAYGTYAMSGEDVLNLMIDDKEFTGWGGEDKDFFERAMNDERISVLRQREHELVHRWHPKLCELGSYVQLYWLEDW